LNSEAILIAGASGLVGTRLTHLLQERGYAVTHLGRSKRSASVKCYEWDPANDWIDPEAIPGKQVIINLAGANIGAKPWTKRRKTEILESRTKSTALLRGELEKENCPVHTFISASGIGYYGPNNGEKGFIEDDPPGNDFLAGITQAWESAADKISALNIRVVKLRTGPVLTANGGVLAEFTRPIRWYVGAPLGSGDQFISWIHIDDLCKIYAYAIEERTLRGVYNAVAPKPVTNREMIKSIARALGKPILLPPIPKFMLKLLLGEMASLALEGNKVSADKIMQAGYTFQFDTLSKALNDIF
jgi:uncharacterized protein